MSDSIGMPFAMRVLNMMRDSPKQLRNSVSSVAADADEQIAELTASLKMVTEANQLHTGMVSELQADCERLKEENFSQKMNALIAENGQLRAQVLALQSWEASIKAEVGEPKIIWAFGTAGVIAQQEENARHYRHRAEHLAAKLKEAQKGLAAVRALINESDGVYGLHRNGDPAPWHELMPPGRYCEWLQDFIGALPMDDQSQPQPLNPEFIPLDTEGRPAPLTENPNET